MEPKTNKILFYLLLFLSFITVIVIYFTADAPYDTGDGITHYLISKYSWKHPYLLLDLWGKPLFTLVSSPFSQFGLKGMYVFQALNAALISWFLFSIASKINLKNTWIIPALIFFAPVYFAVMNSGLVEIFFGTMFMFSVWLVFNKHFYTSAFVASLIPFVRPEAYVVMPLLFLVYVYRRKFLALPLLLSGTVIYTIAGYTHYKDIFWIITKNYKLIGDNYSGFKGSYFHYFHLYDEIWGTVYTFLLLLGTWIIVYQAYMFFRRKPQHEFIAEVFLLFLGSTVGCFILHSLLCGMPGILNNLGILRYLAVLIPGSAFIALIGLDKIAFAGISKFRFIQPLFITTILVLIVRSSFAQWYYPFRQNNEGLVMKQMGIYLQSAWPAYRKICFLHPLLPTVANIDPFDSKKVEVLWSTNLDQINSFADSTLMLWDSHFMRGEGRIPLSALTDNPNFILLKHYKFAYEELPFEACLFLKVTNKTAAHLTVPVELVSEKGLADNTLATDSISFTFDNDPAVFRQWKAKEVLFSGKSAIEFKSETEYGPVFSKKISDLNLEGYISSVKIRFNIFQTDSIMKMVAVIEIKDDDNQVMWEGLVNNHSLKLNLWNPIGLQHLFTEPIKDKDLRVNIYIWNKDKQNFYIKDFNIIFNSRKE